MALSVPPRFTLVFIGPVLEKIERWGAWAKAQGIQAEFEKAAGTLTYRLEYEADEWGRRERELLVHPMDVRRGTVLMLDVRYAVHHAGKQVFVTGLEWRADYPGGRPPG